jgi:AraC family transcriptional regulator
VDGFDNFKIEGGAMRRREYIARINKVIDYINNNIQAELSLYNLALIASFSPYHFHRIFKAIMAENLNDFIQRVRIEKAANLLLHQPDLSITDIALNCGFSSSSIFSRAFRNHFDLTARSFRKLYSKNSNKLINNEIESIASDLKKRGSTQMDVEVKSLPSFHVAYHRHLTGYQKGVYNEKITASFKKVGDWLASHNNLIPNSLKIGITYDNPDITDSDKCRYDTAITISEDIQEVGGDIGIQDIPGGLYAICRIDISRDNIFAQAISKLGEVADYLYGEWLPDSAFQLDDRPCLEIYHYNEANYVIDYCIPIFSERK